MLPTNLYIYFLLFDANTYCKQESFWLSIDIKKQPQLCRKVVTHTPSAGYRAIKVPAAEAYRIKYVFASDVKCGYLLSYF